MEPKYCIDIFGRCPKKFRNRRYEHSLTVHLDEQYRRLKKEFTSDGFSTRALKKFRRKRQYGARINQNFKQIGEHL